MRSLKHGVTALALVFGLVLTAQAGEADKKAAADAPRELKNQTHCPVMGGKIDSTVYTDIQGQRVYHCCPMCSDKLKADPDKFFKKAAEEGVLFENIQTTCPVSGKEIKEKTVFTDYEGRRVYFCCEGCPDTFKKEPATYLEKLEGGSEANAENMEKMDHSDHSGHDH
jgi:YHS domain-containing protein